MYQKHFKIWPRKSYLLIKYLSKLQKKTLYLYKNKNFVIDLPYGEIPEIDKSRKKNVYTMES